MSLRRESWMKRSDSTSACERRDAIRSTAVHVLLRLILAGVLLWLRGECQEDLLDLLLLLLISAGLITIPFSLIALRQRLEELEKGELDEARRY